jgi:multidrug efflux pump subunit AcrA (membrane-fusion protein)
MNLNKNIKNLDLNRKLNDLKNRLIQESKNLLNLAQKKPFWFLFSTLALLLILIIISYFIRNRGREEVISETQPLEVNTYQIGQAPKVDIVGEISKDNIVTISAQTGGIIKGIFVTEGQQIYSGRNLGYIANNYQGGSALSLQRQIAQRQYEHTKETFDNQKGLIAKQKEIANQTEENSDELRKIQQESISETESLLDLNEEVLDYLNQNLENYEATDSANLNRDLIASTQQLKSSYLSAVNQLKSSLRNVEYQTDEDNPPAQLTDLQKQTTIKQLEIQEKALELNKEVSRLQYKLALVNESLAYPSTPVAGVVQKVHVSMNQAISPGRPLFTIQGQSQTAKLTALVSKKIAENISMLENSIVQLDNGEQIELQPDFVSTSATDGTLHTIKYTIPADQQDLITNQTNLIISVPLGYADSNPIIPFVPLQAIYQTNDQAFVYVVEDEQAVSKEIELGEVYGQFVGIKQGLDQSEQIILNRNVIAGQEVIVNN